MLCVQRDFWNAFCSSQTMGKISGINTFYDSIGKDVPQVPHQYRSNIAQVASDKNFQVFSQLFIKATAFRGVYDRCLRVPITSMSVERTCLVVPAVPIIDHSQYPRLIVHSVEICINSPKSASRDRALEAPSNLTVRHVFPFSLRLHPQRLARSEVPFSACPLRRGLF